MTAQRLKSSMIRELLKYANVPGAVSFGVVLGP